MFPSGFIMSPGVDYYVGASFDEATNTAVVYRKDLTANLPLESTAIVDGDTWDMTDTEVNSSRPIIGRADTK